VSSRWTARARYKHGALLPAECRHGHESLTLAQVASRPVAPLTGESATLPESREHAADLPDGEPVSPGS